MQESQTGDLRRRRAFDGEERALIGDLARTTVTELAPEELPVFEEDVRQFFVPPRQHRPEPGEFGTDEILASITTGALTAAAALVEMALVAASVRSWQWIAKVVRDRRDELPLSTVPADGTVADTTALNALYENAYRALREQDGLDDADARRIAASVLAAYVSDRARRPPADRDDGPAA